MTKAAFILDKRTSLKKVLDDFKLSIIEHNFLCNGVTRKEYLLGAVDNADYIVIVGEGMSKGLRSGKVVFDFSKLDGFALLKNNKNHLYIDLICGKGTGKQMFEAIENLALNAGKSQIKLSAMPSAMLQYYRAYDFRFTDSCNQHNNVTRVADAAISEFQEILAQMKNDKKKLGLAKSTKDKAKTQKKIQAYARKISKTTASLERLLSNMNIVANKGCKNPLKCSENGYTMTKCLHHKP
jgi:hypothetical protein